MRNKILKNTNNDNIKIPWILQSKIINLILNSTKDHFSKKWKLSLSLVNWKCHRLVSNSFNHLNLNALLPHNNTINNDNSSESSLKRQQQLSVLILINEILLHQSNKLCVFKYLDRLQCNDLHLLHINEKQPSLLNTIIELDLIVTNKANINIISNILIYKCKSLKHFGYEIINNNNNNGQQIQQNNNSNNNNNNQIDNEDQIQLLNSIDNLISFKCQLICNNFNIGQQLQPEINQNEININHQMISMAPSISFIHNKYLNQEKKQLKKKQLNRLHIGTFNFENEFHMFLDSISSLNNLNKLVISLNKINASLIEQFFKQLQSVNTLSSLIIDQGVGDHSVHLNSLIGYLEENHSLTKLSLPSEVTDTRVMNVLAKKKNIRKLKLSPLIFSDYEQHQYVALDLDKLSIRSIWSSYSFLDRLDINRSNIKRLAIHGNGNLLLNAVASRSGSSTSSTSSSSTSSSSSSSSGMSMAVSSSHQLQNTASITKDLVPFIANNNKIEQIHLTYDDSLLDALKSNRSIRSLSIQLLDSSVADSLKETIQQIFSIISTNEIIESLKLTIISNDVVYNHILFDGIVNTNFRFTGIDRYSNHSQLFFSRE